MHNKLLRYLFLLSLVIAGGILLRGPGARGLTCDASHERTCNGTSQADVNACINGGADAVTTWCAAVDGDIIHLKATPSVTWTSAITVNKNVQIIGAGTGVGGTHINGGLLFALKPHGGTNQPRMILSNIAANKDRTYGSGAMFNVTGVCPINDAHISDPTQSGGFQISNVVITATSNSVANDYLFILGGWPEGCIDHVIVDLDVLPGTPSPPSGEWVIVNFNASPTSLTGTGNGYYAWSHAAPFNSHHLVTFEDDIFHRHSSIDTNQFGGGLSGGAMYRVRHSTLWNNTGGHGNPGDSGSNVSWGLRYFDSHKNLYVRSIDEGLSQQSLNFVDVRGGEATVWGNRFNRYGVNDGQASSSFQVECNIISAWKADDRTGGADGTNPWLENQKGNFTVGSNNYVPDASYNRTYTNPWLGGSIITAGVEKLNSGATSPASDVYAWGTGGIMDSLHTFRLKDGAGVIMAGIPNDKWKDFVVVNLSKTGGVASGIVNPFESPAPTAASTQNYAYISTNGATEFTKLTTNMFDNKGAEWAIGATDHWEMRRVKTYLNVPSHGPTDTLIDDTTTTAGNSLRLVAGTTPTNPKWTNQPTAFGVKKWDNFYRLSPGASFTSAIGPWANLAALCQYACGAFVGDGYDAGVQAGGYLYDPTVSISGNPPKTRVGADAAAWALVPAGGFIDSADNGCPGGHPCSGTQSLYVAGAGGPSPYPHPFVVPAVLTPAVSASGPIFTIAGTDDCAVPSNCVHITTSGFSTSPIVITIDSWSPALSNVTLTDNTNGTGTIHGAAGSNTARSYSTTIHADTATESASTTLSITLQSGNQAPTVSLTSPTSGQNFSPSDTVNLAASASDDVGVTKVEFYDGATLLNSGGDTTSPYTYSTTFSATGAHSLTAKAYDGTTSTTSDAVGITISNALSTPTPPAISYLKP